MPIQHKRTFWGITGLLLLVAIVAMTAAQDALYIDEIRSVEHLGWVNGTHDFAGVIQSIIERSPQHMPAYFLLLRVWSYGVGLSSFALRYLSILIGLLGIAWMYRLGADVFNKKVGFYAAALLGTSAFYVFYLHEMRMYSLLVTAIIFELWIYHRVAIRPEHPNWRDWFGLFIGTLTLASTASHAIFPLAALGMYHLFFVAYSQRKVQVMVIVIAAGLPLIPWLPILMRGSEEIASAPVWLSGFSFFSLLMIHMSNGTGILIAILLALALMHMQRDMSKSLRYIGFVALASALTMFLFNEVLPFMAEYRSGRYYLTLYPALLVLAAVGLTALHRWRYGAILVLLVWIAGGIWYSQTLAFSVYNNREGETAFREFAPLPEIMHQFNRLEIGTPQAFVVTLSNHPSAFWERRQGEFHYALMGVQGVVVNEPMLQDIVREERLSEIGIREHYPTIFLAYDPQTIAEPFIELATTTLEENYRLCAVPVNTIQLHIAHYIQKPFDCALTTIPHSPIVTYVEEAITLHGVETVIEDDTVHLAMAWQVQPSVPLHAYSASVRVLDADGNTVLQQDYGLEHSARGYWYLLTMNMGEWQASTYRVDVVVYNWTTNQQLTGVDIQDTHSNQHTVFEFEKR